VHSRLSQSPIPRVGSAESTMLLQMRKRKRKRPDDRSCFSRICIGCKDVITWAACLEFLRIKSIRRNPIQTALLQMVLSVGRFGRLEELGPSCRRSRSTFAHQLSIARTPENSRSSDRGRDSGVMP